MFMISLNFERSSSSKSLQLAEEILDTWIRGESERGTFDDTDEKESSALETASKHEATMSLFKQQNQEGLDQAKNILKTLLHTRKKEEKKKHTHELLETLKKLKKNLVSLGMPKKEAKTTLFGMLKMWEHDSLVEKYSKFVEIPDQFAESVVSGAHKSRGDINAFQIIP